MHTHAVEVTVSDCSSLRSLPNYNFITDIMRLLDDLILLLFFVSIYNILYLYTANSIKAVLPKAMSAKGMTDYCSFLTLKENGNKTFYRLI